MPRFLLIMTGFFAGCFLLFGFAGSAQAIYGYSPEVKVYNPRDLHIDADFYAFSRSFKGGSNITVGDINNDGFGEIIVGAGVGGGPQVRVFNRDGSFNGLSFFAFANDFSGGVDVAVGDVDGDGMNELITSQASNGQTWVKVYKPEEDNRVVGNFLAYSSSFKGGVNIAAGDIDGNGTDEIITGSNLGGGPQVRTFNAIGEFLGWSTFAFEEDFHGGIDVAAGNVDGGEDDEIIVSQKIEGQAWVKVYKGDDTKQILGNWLAYPSSHKGGAVVAAADVDSDGMDEVITGVGERGAPQVRAFEAYGAPLAINFYAYENAFRGGVRVAGGNLDGGDIEEIVTVPGRVEATGRTDYPKYIEINLSEQRLYAYEHGVLEKEYLISSGNPWTPTPTGTFGVYRKRLSVLMQGSDYYLPGVPYVLSFTGAYTIHGTYWHSNFGHTMSHGCVNMYTLDAQWLYDWAPVGTPVIIHY